MDCYIYDADVYCEACAEAIKDRLRDAGNEPADPDDERSYDSGEWPKGPFSGQESDCPAHCGSGPECLDPMTLNDGNLIGCFLENPLTFEGQRYVRQAHRETPSEITAFWVSFYGLELDETEDE
jgi:hypothetical protein